MIHIYRYKIFSIVGILLLTIVLDSCNLKRPVIRVPENLGIATRMPVMGGERSWHLMFGAYEVYDIQERTGQEMMSLLQDQFYKILAFEFLIKDNIGNQWTCWCEYPERQYWESQLKCIFQESKGTQSDWSLNDGAIVYQDRKIVINDYFETGNKKRRMGLGLDVIGYTFSIKGQVIGLVDISGTPGYEAVWIHPNISIESKIAVAAASSAIIIKYRRWYHERTLRLLESSE